MDSISDPYVAPHARLEVATDLVALYERREYLGIEAGMRGVAALCLVFGVVFAGFGAMSLVAIPGGMPRLLLYPALALLAGLFALATAWGYAFLKPWARWASLVVAPLAMLGSYFLATPLVAYAAWLTWSPTGRRVLSREHAALRARTPRMSAWSSPGHACLLLCALGLYVAAFYSITQGLQVDD